LKKNRRAAPVGKRFVQQENQEPGAIAMGLFDSFVQAVNREYDRRIKRASEVIEYGMGHGHGHGHDHDHDRDYDHDQGYDQGQEHKHEHEPASIPHDEYENDGAAIANVPAGTRVEHQQEDV